MIRIFFLLIIISSSAVSFAQKQLILLKREKVVLRLYPGDEFKFKLKNSRHPRTSYVNNIFDTAVVAHHDTIPFHKIERIYFPQTKLYNIIGGGLVVGGGLFFLIDQFNEILVQGNDPSLDSRVSSISITSIAVGLPLMLIKKRSQRMGFKYKLLMATKNSVFYRPDPKGFESPYIPEN